MSSALQRRKLASAAARLNARHTKAGLLPPLALMTDDERLADPPAAARALPRGSMVVVRSRDSARRAALGQAIMRIAARRGLVVLIANDAALAARLGADGLHLAEAFVSEAAYWRARFPRWIITAAAHGRRGGQPHLDAMFLSPVFPTASHPDRAALSASRANRIAQAMPLPLYALGGVTARNARLLSGFVGIAAVGALAP